MKTQAKGHGLDWLPLYLEVSRGYLEASLEQLQNLEFCKNSPHLLDDDIIKRILKAHKEQNEVSGIFLEQCRQWRTQNPNEDQRDAIEKVEGYTKRFLKTNERLLFLANHYKDHTIDCILAKKEGELAIEYLMGTLYEPLEEDVDKTTPLGPGTYHDLKILENPNEEEIKKLYKIKPAQTEVSSLFLAEAFKNYANQRTVINAFHKDVEDDAFLDIVEASKELGNFDPVEDMPVLQNDAETNIFYDYLTLYRQKNGKRFILDWVEKNPDSLTAENEEAVDGYCKARFSLLRLDKNLANGAIQVVDVLSKKSFLLIDKALNESRKEGCFFFCSIVGRKDYIMTTGGGILVDGRSPGGKALLTLYINHKEAFQNTSTPFTKEIAKAVREIYGFCLRNGALTYMTIK